ncbi:tail fiber assembly protein [Arsenophonus nasoniae]|uniref:tail fiber assembly protein n=1 Tax=Arsenophonus nasoniae TaxID=638 RepID=UPI003879276B
MDKFFKRYKPEDQSGASYASLTNGTFDWYEYQKILSNDKYKLMIDVNDFVISASKDASTLFPENCKVVEIDEIPPDFSDKLGRWRYHEGKIIYIDDDYLNNHLSKTSEGRIFLKSSFLDEASKIIAPLRDTVDLGMATENEIEILKKWKKYRVLLNRINPIESCYEDWPQKPVT